jgi:hypothetical protein
MATSDQAMAALHAAAIVHQRVACSNGARTSGAGDVSETADALLEWLIKNTDSVGVADSEEPKVGFFLPPVHGTPGE